MTAITNVVFPVLTMDGKAYLLLDTIPETLKKPVTLDFIASVQDLGVLRKRCEATSQITHEGEVAIHTYILRPKTSFHIGDLISRFSTEEISYSICVSSSRFEARGQALEIIKNFGESFLSTSQKEEILTRALSVLHADFIGDNSKIDKTKVKIVMLVGIVIFSFAAISLIMNKMSR